MNHPAEPAEATGLFEVEAGGRRYRLALPHAATDYIQKKIAAERRPYEAEMLEDLRARVAPGSLVVDVGANVGNHAIYLAAVADCRVEAFEPNAALAQAISASAALNGLEDRVRVHALGAGATASRADFGQERPDNIGAQRLRLGDGPIEVVALDTLRFDGRVAALKVDVEGMEIDVLRGAEALIARDRPLLYVECIGDTEFRVVSRWLDDRGYTFWDTFNATPTHLFLPIEVVSLDRRLARLQLRAVHEEYRTTAIATAVRQRLARAYDNEREAKQKAAELTRDLAVAQAEAANMRDRVAKLESELSRGAAARDALSTGIEAVRREARRHEERAAALEAEGETLRTQLRQHAERIERLQAELRRTEQAARTLEGELRRSQADSGRLRDEVARSSARLDELHASAERERAAGRERALRLERDLGAAQRELAAAGRALGQKTSRLAAAEKRLELLANSHSYLLGSALVGATRSWRAALRLPARLWAITRSGLSRRRAQREAAALPLPKPDGAVPASPPASPPALPPRPALGPRSARAIASVAELRVACVFDEFTFHAFAPECRLQQLDAGRWPEQVADFDPDFVFIESAWRGANDSWYHKVSDPSTELLALVDWAVARGVSTAFWAKEDPVHFARFLPVARLVDHVFTTDIDCIARYKDALKHDRVHLLPFAAQPALHHPIETAPRTDAFGFAGSWYPQYPGRQADFRTLVQVARKLKSVEIWDRKADRPPPHDFVFPEEFRAEIRGRLPYAEIDRAYKGTRFGITVNTIKQSQTMFARRALELMASNTVVVSNFSRGLRLLFGDHVVSSDSAVELEHRLAPLATDAAAYRRQRLRALRKVLAEHTYEHRLAYVAGKLIGRPVAARAPRVAMVGEVSRADEAAALGAAFARQRHAGAALLLVGPVDALAGAPGARGLADRTALASALAEFDYVASVAASDYHGPDYLADLALATRFARGDGVTKGAHFVRDATGAFVLHDDGAQYRPAAQAVARRSLLRAPLVTAWLGGGAAGSLADAVFESGSLVAVDEFGWCEAGGADPEGAAAAVDVVPLARPGVSLAGELLPIAEAITAPAVGGEGDRPMVFGAADWQRLLPREIDLRLAFAPAGDGLVELRSELPADQNQYVYFTRRFRPAELKAERETFFQFEADARLDLRTVFVFLDADGTKISHAMATVGARYPLAVPAGTMSVRFGLRVQGPGRAVLGRLTLAQSRGLPPQPLASAPHLVVANQYPDYDDLYRYGFVHARVRAYRRAGIGAEVLRLSADPQVVWREFEDVDVTQADHAFLDRALAAGRHTSVLIHILDPRIWEVVRRHLDRVRVVVWAHGAEIQPWWRRAMNHPTDALRDQARRTSDQRMAMWREVLSLHHPNLRVVFISHKQAAEVLSDLRLRAAEVDDVAVIPNYIDGDLFRYVPKDAGQRHRILSIRPFASHVYANDLTVQAILRLAREPFFDQLRFHVVGDGALFDETVAPIRNLPNVQITRAFLTQRQIAALHRDYGVFLVPSRMDSQGVSRDEAMASGLVPITTRVAAIPEFVDEGCAFLAAPEDAAGLADAVRRLHEDPALFARLSAAAAARVRAQSGHAQTIARELALFAAPARERPAPAPVARLADAEAAATRIALYGDVNLNVMDGSAVWAASLAEVLAGVPGMRVSLVLKARIHRTQVVARLLDLTPAVQFVEPEIPERAGLAPADAVAWLEALDREQPFRAFVLRGLDVCHEAARRPGLAGRIWAYLTDVPQRAELMDEATRTRIAAIVGASEFVLCQTPQMRDYFVGLFPGARERAQLLPPMVPPAPAPAGDARAERPFRFCYAGKFAPRWGIRELFAAQRALRAADATAELHVFGDKIHNPADDPSFQPAVRERLEAGDGLLWHGAVDRDELLRRLRDMHACWAFRDPAFERETLELSTKALEYASLGLPTILARSPVVEAVFGDDYPLFAADAAEATALLLRLAAEPELRRQAAERLRAVADRYTFDAVRDNLRAEGLAPPQRPAAAASSPAPAPALTVEAP